MNTRRQLALSAMALAAALAGSPALAQQTIKLTAAAGHPPVFLWVKTVDEVLILAGALALGLFSRAWRLQPSPRLHNA